ncbi:MAG: tRNA dihydrouridine(20/20a) synthase DusA, partial [Sutterella sp.]
MTDLRPEDWRLSVAPMLDWTDRHCRYFHRLLTARTRLYTEMVTTGAVIFGDRERLLGFSPAEHPVALQLGGSDPSDLAKSVRIASAYGYDEFNLNCGCPSERVQKGSFGACLMLEPETVAACVRAMMSETDRPVSVKHRIGVDDRSDYGFVRDFVGTVYDAGCRVFIVHTRAAWLKGLSPKENREVPPLIRETAFALKKDFPDTVMVINGAVPDLSTAGELIAAGMDGVMIGRAAYQNPWMLAQADETIYGETHDCSRLGVIRAMTDYLKEYFPDDINAVRAAARHMNGLTQGLPGARRWRQVLSDPT